MFQFQHYTDFTDSHKHQSTTSASFIIHIQGEGGCSFPLQSNCILNYTCVEPPWCPWGCHLLIDLGLGSWSNYYGKRVKFTLTPRQIRPTHENQSRDNLKRLNLCTMYEGAIYDAIFFTFLHKRHFSFYILATWDYLAHSLKYKTQICVQHIFVSKHGTAWQPVKQRNLNLIGLMSATKASII